jgi:hypothetical protein
MTSITPTVGRVIHYYPTADDNGALPPQGQPLAGIVACVWNDRCINITYFDANGNAWGKTSVPLVQDDDETRPGAGYCAWMPYQKGQVAKTELAESALCLATQAFDQLAHAARDIAIEKEIQAKGLTAPRITPADIEANIASEHYFTAADGARMSSHGNHPIHNLNTGSLGLLTFCVLVLRNGFTVTGESACASPANFDAEIGRKIARQNAIDKVWPLMGYALKERLSGE